MKLHRITTRAVALAAAVLAGCAVPPAERHETPLLDLPAVAAVVPGVPIEWWKTFNDARLDALVAEALANNRDLARAMARIDESRAVLRSANANQLPRVDANASASRQRFGENAPLTIGGNQLTFNDFRANLSASYELDLWSRAANLSAAARDELLAKSMMNTTMVAMSTGSNHAYCSGKNITLLPQHFQDVRKLADGTTTGHPRPLTRRGGGSRDARPVRPSRGASVATPL